MYAGAYYGSVGYTQLLIFGELIDSILHSTVPEPIGSGDNAATLELASFAVMSTVQKGDNGIIMSNESDSGILNLE